MFCMVIALNCTDFSVLYCTVLHCTALHCTMLNYTSLYCTFLHCIAWQSIVMHLTKQQPWKPEAVSEGHCWNHSQCALCWCSRKCAVCIVQFSAYCGVLSVQCAMNTVKFNCVLYSVCIVQCAVCHFNCSVPRMMCGLFSVHCSVCCPSGSCVTTPRSFTSGVSQESQDRITVRV